MKEDTIALLYCIEQMGYSTAIRKFLGGVEARASALSGETPDQVGLCMDGDGEEEEFRAVELLAEAICG